MDKLTAIKIEQEDGTYSDEIPVGADASNITMTNGYSVQTNVGNIDIDNDGTIADQLTKLKNSTIQELRIDNDSLIINTV